MQVLVKVFGHIELRFSLQALLAGGRTLVDHGLRCLVEIDKLVALFETCQLVFDAAEFAANDLYAVVDKLGSVECHAVFVFNHVFLIRVIECGQHLVGTLYVGVVAVEHNERCLLVVLAGREHF